MSMSESACQRRRPALLTAIFCLAALLSGGCVSADADHAAGSEVGVSLVVLITIDQLRGDYLDRFGEPLEGGLARFRDQGAYFPGARQHHAVTSTAPGHASLLSGRYPAHTGIMANDSGVPDPAHPVLDAPNSSGASPHRFRGTALFDWLLAADPDTRMLSVARKDRGAILPIGRARGHVYWWGDTGFSTSTYYADALPGWVQVFNAGLRAEDWTGRVWDMLLDPAAYPEPEDPRFPKEGPPNAFPHHMPDDPYEVFAALEGFPWMDSLTLALALQGVREVELGARGRPDLLTIGLSTLDPIGHDFGPDSREVRDHLVRLDRWLGDFFDALAEVVPAERTVFVLASDHGIMALPEYVREVRGGPAGRVSTADLRARHLRSVEARFDQTFGFALHSGLFLADLEALAARGVDADSLADALATDLRALEGVRRVITRRELAALPEDDYDALLWRRSLPDDLGWLAATMAEPNYQLTSSSSVQHGHVQPENMSIPLAFLGAGIAPGRHDRMVESVDIAPTLAALLGLREPPGLDGRILPEVVGRGGAVAGGGPR